MGKKSKRKANRQQKLEKARKFNLGTSQTKRGVLSSKLTRLPKEGIIPDNAPEDAGIIEPLEKELAINFIPCCLKHQQIDQINGTDAKSLIRRLSCLNSNNKSYAEQCLIKCKVINSKSYKFLYRNQSPDIDIFEVKFRGEKGTIFGYFLGNIFYIVAIRTSHINLH